MHIIKIKKTKKINKINKTKKKFFILKKNKKQTKKNRRKYKKYRKSNNKKSKRRVKWGGMIEGEGEVNEDPILKNEITSKDQLDKISCKADPSAFPKCGKEGCVYLTENDTVTKKQWKNDREMDGYFLSIEGQQAAQVKNLAPKIISQNIKPCDLISKIGSENKAPCIVKRRRKTKSGEKIAYEEEKRESWCRNYGVENQCIVDENMYNRFKNSSFMNSALIDTAKIPKEIILPDVDSSIDGDVDSIDDEDLGDMLLETKIDKSFTNYNPVFLTDLKMERIKGLTISELITKMVNSLGEEDTKTVSKVWEDERDNLIEEIKRLGYASNDFNEDNIMIDVDDEELCNWINEMLNKKETITPEKIKQHFGKENILKIVDWGILRRVR